MAKLNGAIVSKVSGMEPEDIEGTLVQMLTKHHEDPASMPFPPMLPFELAMRIDTPKNICAAYQIDKPEWDRLRSNPIFVKAVHEATEMLKTEGMSFRMKAQMQAEDLLGTAHALAKNPNISDASRVKMIELIVRWAGFDKKAEEVNAPPPFTINLNLS